MLARLRDHLRDLFRIEPIAHARWELLILRVFLALLVWDTYSGAIGLLFDHPLHAFEALLQNPWDWTPPYRSQPHPLGLAAWFDLTWIADETTSRVLRLSSIASLITYIAGVPAAYSLAVPVFHGVLTFTFTSSQGHVGHTAQVLHVALLVVWLGGIYSEWARCTHRRLPRGYSAGQWQADLVRQSIAAGYVASALTKLWHSRGDWFSDAQFFPLAMTKNMDMEYYDKLDPAAQQLAALPDVLLHHPALCQLIFGLGLPLELCACIGLFNRKLAACIGLALFVFHVTVTELMQLAFVFNKALLLAFFIAPWWWLVQGVQRLLRALRH